MDLSFATTPTSVAVQQRYEPAPQPSGDLTTLRREAGIVPFGAAFYMHRMYRAAFLLHM